MKAKRLLLPLLCLSLFATGLGIVGYNFSKEKKEKDEEPATDDFFMSRLEPPSPLFKERLQKVEREIAIVKNSHEAQANLHFWAGRYEFSHDHGFAELSLAPREYTLRESPAHFEVYYRHGQVWWDKDTNTITLDGTHHYPLEYKPVRWGERLYLIPTPRIIEFCYDINQGSEPRNDRGWGRYLLRQGDWEKEAKGQPEVPEEFKKYLLDEPVDAKIVSIPRTEYDSKWGENISVVVLDKGAKDGLQPGMRLSAEEREGSGYHTVTLTTVEETQSEGKLYFTGRPGQQFSTYPKWMREINEWTRRKKDRAQDTK